MRFTEKSVSVAEEQRIVTGLIVSNKVCKDLLHHTRLEYFTNDYLKTVASWCLSFYEEFEKAPFKHINDIFISEQPRMKDSHKELIDELLTNLSKRYSGDDINADYIVQSAEEYYRKRELEITTNNISVLTERGDLEEAELEIQRYNKVSIDLDASIYIDPGDIEARERIYKKRDEIEQGFFKLPGDLGDYLGNIKPGDVIGITGPAKRGKSFLLNDCNKQAILSRIHTLKWSIEMTDSEELERLDKAFYPMVCGEAGMYKYPSFDCMLNQIGDCGDRLSTVIVRDDEKSDLIEHPDHVPCTKCRNHPVHRNRFKPVVYNVDIYRDDNSIFTIRKKMGQFLKQMSRYSRLIVRPKYSLTYDLMMRDLEVMHSRYNFIPSILILDYIDILSIRSVHDDYKLEDEKWKLLQKIAGSTKCAVITATQANKEGAKAHTLHGTDQGGYYGKSRHVNLMMAINQTPAEKRMGLWRCGLTDSRSNHQNEEDTCIVLQDLKTGQFHIDSYWGGRFNPY